MRAMPNANNLKAMQAVRPEGVHLASCCSVQRIVSAVDHLLSSTVISVADLVTGIHPRGVANS